MKTTSKEKIWRDKNGLYDDVLSPEPARSVIKWFKKPFKKVGELHGVKIITIKPFPKIDL